MLLLSGCADNKIGTSNISGNPRAAAVYCWYVEDNGSGNRGYALLSTLRNSPLTSNEPLYSTIEQLGEALNRHYGKSINLVPKFPKWVPKGWMVRDLNSNELDNLGYLLQLIILKN